MIMAKERLYYNQEVKERYLEQFDNEQSKHIYQLPLKKAKEFEESLGKDIYEMNLNELTDLLYSFKPTSTNAAYHNFLRISNYIDFAIENGYAKSNISEFAVISDTVEWNKKFVANYMNTFFTREEILEMVDDLYNAVDGAILLSLFEGLGGKGYSELINLEIKHVHRGDPATVRLFESADKERTIKISNELVEILHKANMESEYVANNGEINELDGRHISDYIESDKVFKKSKKGANAQEGLNSFFVQRKFAFFKKVFESDYLRPKNIVHSGMMYMAHKLYQESGKFDREEILKIAEQFDTPWVKSGSTTYRNVSIIKNIVDIPEFEKMYGYKLPIE